MANKSQTIVIRGELSWAKLLGKARPYDGNPKYDKGPYWSVDITPDEKSRALLAKAGISKKLRDPSDKDSRTASYLTLKVLQNKKDGTPNLDSNGNQIVPRVVDIQGKKWDNDSLIGNGSVADVKLNVVDYDGTTGVYLQATRILKHVPYQGQDFAPVDSDDEFFAQSDKKEATDSPSVDDFDDGDVPF